MRWSTNKAIVGSLEGCEAVRVLVGDDQREFTLHRKLLAGSCAFFQTHLDAIPSSSSSSPPPPPPPSSSSSKQPATAPASAPADEEEDSVLWLPSESPDMFELFVLWLYQRRRFPFLLGHAVRPMRPDECRALRTSLVRLHLFAAVIDLPVVQDAAMDALQDMYLRFDWDMSPHFLSFLYGDCDAARAVRLRKWAIAMFAWTLNGSDKAACMAGAVEKLFAAYPDLQADYRMHIQKMALSRADIRIKNPQLRLPVNKLQSGERLFGFRQCTFHSHRASVGEGACPHALQTTTAAGGAAGQQAPVPLSVLRARGVDKEEVESDVSDADPIISPVRDLNEVSYLDLS